MAAVLRRCDAGRGAAGDRRRAVFHGERAAGEQLVCGGGCGDDRAWVSRERARGSSTASSRRRPCRVKPSRHGARRGAMPTCPTGRGSRPRSRRVRRARSRRRRWARMRSPTRRLPPRCAPRPNGAVAPRTVRALAAGRAGAAARGGRALAGGCGRVRPMRLRAPKSSSAACRVIDDPRFAAVFGPESLAEAPIAAVVAGGAVVAGTVDRLLVSDERGAGDRLQDRAASAGVA